MNHPEHGTIVERELNSRIHDGKEMWFCKRCGNYVPKDEPEQFDEIDCDQYKEVRERISGELP